MNFISVVFNILTYFCSNVHITQPYKTDRTATVLYTVTRGCLWTECGFKPLFRIHKICKTPPIFEVRSFFPSSCEILRVHPKYVNVFTCSVTLLYAVSVAEVIQPRKKCSRMTMNEELSGGRGLFQSKQPDIFRTLHLYGWKRPHPQPCCDSAST